MSTGVILTRQCQGIAYTVTPHDNILTSFEYAWNISSSLLGVGVKPWVIGADHDSKMKRTEMRMIREMCGKRSKIDRTELR